MALHDIVAERRGEIVARWTERVQGTIAPTSLTPPELVNHLPSFLDTLVTALREGDTNQSELPRIAAVHGEQRLRLGFKVESLVLEYGALRTAIMETARAAGTEPTVRELDVLFDTIVSGITHAVSEYARRRDAEFVRQTNENFAFIAHELRNPLSSATAAVHILKVTGQLPAEGRAVDGLERGLQRTLELIDHTLNLARVASGVEIRRNTTTLRALLQEAESGVSAEAEAREIALHLVVNDDQPVVLDARLIQSALDNLTRNAVKHTVRHGTVELRARVVNGHAVLEVEDRCGGLPSENVERAFAPFVQLDPGKSGFGLGLAIAKQAVDAHGGTIRVENLACPPLLVRC